MTQFLAYEVICPKYNKLHFENKLEYKEKQSYSIEKKKISISKKKKRKKKNCWYTYKNRKRLFNKAALTLEESFIVALEVTECLDQVLLLLVIMSMNVWYVGATGLSLSLLMVLQTELVLGIQMRKAKRQQVRGWYFLVSHLWVINTIWEGEVLSWPPFGYSLIHGLITLLNLDVGGNINPGANLAQMVWHGSPCITV